MIHCRRRFHILRIEGPREPEIAEFGGWSAHGTSPFVVQGLSTIESVDVGIISRKRNWVTFVIRMHEARPENVALVEVIESTAAR
jgi:hypothetical protein